MRNPGIQIIIVEHRDRLMRFGFEFVEATLDAQGLCVPGYTASDLPRTAQKEQWMRYIMSIRKNEKLLQGIGDVVDTVTES